MMASNLFSNLKTKIDEKNDLNLLCQALDKLKFILNRVNDAVAFYQNSNEFKKVYENIDSKSFTYSLIKVDKQIEQRKISVRDNILCHFNNFCFDIFTYFFSIDSIENRYHK